jgi:DNA-binding CsgD family transcriptional regulator
MTRQLFPASPAKPAGSVLLISVDPVLGAALQAGLTEVGWRVDRQRSWIPSERHPPDQHLVLVADATGAVPSGPALGRPAGTTCVVVGSRLQWSALVRALSDGVRAAVDIDLPFTDLVRRLDELLRNPTSAAVGAQLRLELELRERLAAGFAQLTRREREVLIAVMQGFGATEIAEQEHVSLATVRSHLQSLLGKLNVSSQLAAVALTIRSCADPEVIRALRQIHHF